MMLRDLFVCVVLLATTLLTACGRSADLKGQTNTTFTFYGQVVDQDGNPLSGAKVTYQVEAYPKDWTFATRGRPYDVSNVTATSDAQGRFSFQVTGCFLRLIEASREGYKHLWEQDTSDGCQHASVYAYQLIVWSDLCHKSDPDHPAVFVFVKDGMKEVSALPCKGGYDFNSGTADPWKLNEPGWPRKPSLLDVVRKRPATKQAAR